MSEELEQSGAHDESISELVEQLGRDASRLALTEAALGASQRVPDLRPIVLNVAVALAAVLALLTAFALGNWAAVTALSYVLPTWLAALALAVAWIGVGIVLLATLRRRAERTSRVAWWQMIGGDRGEAIETLQQSRDEAEQALRETIDHLSGAIAGAAADHLADAVVPLAGAAVDVGEELLEASEDVVEAIEEQLPGGRAVGQVIDIVLFPGRLGIRIATTVLRGSSNQASG